MLRFMHIYSQIIERAELVSFGSQVRGAFFTDRDFLL